MVISRYSKRFRGKAKPLLLDVAVVSVHQSGQPTMDSIVSNPGRSTQVSFDIRNFYDRLEPGNGKNKYVCPVCGGRNLEIKPNCGTYHCFTSDCDNAAIREALRPWAEVVAERGGNGDQKINSNRRPASAIRKKQPTPAPIPAGLKLLQFV